jgi:hypothetical protein
MWKQAFGAVLLAGGIASAQPAVQANEVPLAAIDIARGDTANLTPDLGKMRSVRLKALRGAAYIDYVEVKLDNGEVQHVDVNKQLARDESAEIDLNGKRGIQSITVHGTPDEGARIQIIGLR